MGSSSGGWLCYDASGNLRGKTLPDASRSDELVAGDWLKEQKPGARVVSPDKRITYWRSGLDGLGRMVKMTLLELPRKETA